MVLAVFACTVYGKNVFSKEPECLHTVNVFIFVPKSAEYKQFCSVQGSSPWWPSRELYVLLTCDLSLPLLHLVPICIVGDQLSS